jgi:hypothetical protein
MSAFYIWNPYLVPDNRSILEFVLTNGDVDGIGQDKEFIENILKDINVKADVANWSIEPYRTSYYSDYLDGDDWRDTWQPIWKVRVIMKEEIDSLPRYKTPSIETNATGEDWSARPSNNAIIGCLVIADFKSESSLQKAQAAIASRSLKQMQEKYSVGIPTFSRSEVLRKYKQLQINLGKFPGEFFASGADYAERVMDLCRKARGTVHYDDRLE